MAARRKRPVERAHELNRRIKNNPGERLRVIQEFYSEMVEAGERETAELVLVIRSMMEDDNKIPPWFQTAGFVTGVLTLLFFMSLVIVGILGHEVPSGSKFLVVAALALGCALSAAFLGGHAAATGKIPFFGNAHPLAISTTGGVAILVIVLVLGHYFYA
jgi:hypothetical protein